MAWTINWDNGLSACGTWGHLVFDTKEEAQQYADDITEEMIAIDCWTEEGLAEPYWLEPKVQPSSEQVDSTVEQSADYFNRYIAGDR